MESVKKYLLNKSKSYISKDELLKDVRQAEIDYKLGKTIKAKSMADIL